MVKNPVNLIKRRHDDYIIIRGRCYSIVGQYSKVYRRNCAYETYAATTIGYRICLKKLR
jgi:hypothetical protein